MYTIVSLHLLKRHLGIDAAITAEDDRLLDALEAASAEIERLANRRFLPHVATYKHSINPARPDELLLEGDLLSLTEIMLDDGSTIANTDAVPLPGDGQPAGIIQLVNGASFTYTVSPYESVSVRGIWGWHPRQATMWRDSGDTLQHVGVLTGDALTLDVVNVDGSDLDRVQPRFQVGQLLRLEDEYLWLTGIDADLNKLFVQRGVLGTGAASYIPGTSVYIYQPPEDLVALVLRWAAWLYRSADQPDAAPPDGLRAAVNALRRDRVR